AFSSLLCTSALCASLQVRSKPPPGAAGAMHSGRRGSSAATGPARGRQVAASRVAKRGIFIERVSIGVLFCVLPDRQGVADDQAVLIGVTGEIGTEHGVAQTYGDIFQRPALDHVLELDIALPLAAGGGTAGDLGMVAGNVAGQEGQAGYADGGEVVVVACLPGALVGIGEVVDLHEVDQEGVAAVDIGKAGIAAHLLVGEADLVAVQAVAEHAVPGLVVDLAGVGRTAVLAQTHAQVGAQFTGPYGLFGEQAEEVLAVDIVEVGEVIAAGDLVAEPVVDTGQIQMIGLGATGEAAVLV